MKRNNKKKFYSHESKKIIKLRNIEDERISKITNNFDIKLINVSINWFKWYFWVSLL